MLNLATSLERDQHVFSEKINFLLSFKYAICIKFYRNFNNQENNGNSIGIHTNMVEKIGKIPEKIRKNFKNWNFDLLRHLAPPGGVWAKFEWQNRPSLGSICPRTDREIDVFFQIKIFGSFSFLKDFS